MLHLNRKYWQRDVFDCVIKGIMKKIVLFGGTGSSNRGCEAIIKSTAEILKKHSQNILLGTFNLDDDYDCCLDSNITPLNLYCEKKIIDYFKAIISKFPPLYYVLIEVLFPY